MRPLVLTSGYESLVNDCIIDGDVWGASWGLRGKNCGRNSGLRAAARRREDLGALSATLDLDADRTTARQDVWFLDAHPHRLHARIRQ